MSTTPHPSLEHIPRPLLERLLIVTLDCVYRGGRWSRVEAAAIACIEDAPDPAEETGDQP